MNNKKKESLQSTIAMVIMGAWIVTAFLYVDQVNQNEPLKKENTKLKELNEKKDAINKSNIARLDSSEASSERYSEVFTKLKNKRK